MSHALTEIRLYGPLGVKFGRMHRLAVSSFSEAVAALCALLPGFKAEMIGSGERGIRYACFLGKRNLAESELDHAPAQGEAIRIAPMLAGAKGGGLFQTLLGAAIIAFAVWNPFSLMTAKVAFAVGAFGASMALGGVAQMLAPKQMGLSTKDNPENTPSYNFNGPVNTTAQGNCVPLLYGEMIAGSAVASAGIYSEDQQ